MEDSVYSVRNLVKGMKRDPEVDKLRNVLSCMNYMENPPPSPKCFPFEKAHFNGEGSRMKNRSLGHGRRRRQQILVEFTIKRMEEKEKLRELKKQKKEMKKIKREKKVLKKLKREKKELKKMKKANLAETTTKVDEDGVPLKKLKLDVVEDDHVNVENLKPDVVSSEDADLLRRRTSPNEQVGNSMEQGLKLCTREAELKRKLSLIPRTFRSA